MEIREPTQAPLVIGHRGAVGYAPENTLAAFVKGFELAAEWVETDVRATKDGTYVLMHDATVDRTTNGTGHVAQMAIEEIKDLDAGSWFDVGYRGVGIPTLGDLLAWAKDKIGVCLDLHPSLEPKDVEKIAHQVQSYDLADRSLVISSEFEHLIHAKLNCPELTTGILFPSESDDIYEQVTRNDIDFLHPNRHIVSPALIEKAHNAGIPVAASVFSDEHWISERLEWGLDIINCDHPDLPQKVWSSQS
jgi:glycerophosphoryl diester phosphodiesterase